MPSRPTATAHTHQMYTATEPTESDGQSSCMNGTPHIRLYSVTIILQRNRQQPYVESVFSYFITMYINTIKSFQRSKYTPIYARGD